MSEYPTGEEFLHQHGNLAIFAKGFTALERKYLRFLLVRISGLDDVADVDIRKIAKEDLQRIWNVRIASLQSAVDHQDLLPYFRQKTKTELHIKVL